MAAPRAPGVAAAGGKACSAGAAPGWKESVGPGRGTPNAKVNIFVRYMCTARAPTSSRRRAAYTHLAAGDRRESRSPSFVQRTVYDGLTSTIALLAGHMAGNSMSGPRAGASRHARATPSPTRRHARQETRKTAAQWQLCRIMHYHALQAASNTRSLWRAGPVARCSFAPLPHAEATRFADRVVRMRRTAKPLLHRLTVHFSNKFVRAQVAARNSGDVVCHAHTSEKALRESWESTSDRHAARRIGTSPPAAAAPAAPAPAPALGCPRRAAPLLTSGARRMQASSWASAS